mmetsp:Transcript_44317/g.118249  ORF Transcript_44317/g.118249 Transcript_44317/m.118249 type:complete len:208 (+) Transcript_44317:189-812(+)
MHGIIYYNISGPADAQGAVRRDQLDQEGHRQDLQARGADAAKHGGVQGRRAHLGRRHHPPLRVQPAAAQRAGEAGGADRGGQCLGPAGARVHVGGRRRHLHGLPAVLRPSGNPGGAAKDRQGHLRSHRRGGGNHPPGVPRDARLPPPALRAGGRRQGGAARLHPAGPARRHPGPLGEALGPWERGRRGAGSWDHWELELWSWNYGTT